MSLLKLLKRCSRRSMRVDWGESNKMAEELNLDREGLPNSTTEREIIEHYFHRGYEYKSIVLLLAKYHDIRLSERSLKRKLKDFGLKRREHVDENLEIRVRNIITEELSAGPDRLNGYRSMWHILRLRHHMNVPRQLKVLHFENFDVFIDVLMFVQGQILPGTSTAMINLSRTVFRFTVVLTALVVEYCGCKFNGQTKS